MGEWERRTRLGKLVKIPANPLELCRRHLNCGSIFGFGNSQMLLVDIHQLDIVLAYPVRLRALEHQVHGIRRVVGLQSQHILVLSSPQDLGQRDQIDAQGDVAVAAVGREPFGAEQHGHQRHVRVVHGLQGDSGVIAVEVAVLHEILDGVGDLQFTILVSIVSFGDGGGGGGGI